VKAGDLFILLIGCSGSLPAGPLADNESVNTTLYSLTFGAQGQGTNLLHGTGLENHGAYGTGVNLRFYDGERGGSQPGGIYQIYFKNNRRSEADDETISDILPNRVPAVGSALAGGGKFDGTALWLGHSRFQPGSTTSWNGVPMTKADGGADIRPDPDHFILVPVSDGATNVSFLLSQQIFVPDHARDKQGPSAIPRGVCVQPYVDREGAGLTTAGGHGFRTIEFVPDQWHLLQIRADFVFCGGNSGGVTYRYFVDGTQVGAADACELVPEIMTKRRGPIRFGPGFGLMRGWQGSAPEAFVDNITTQPIFRAP
jgi:hypothetical protein